MATPHAPTTPRATRRSLRPRFDIGHCLSLERFSTVLSFQADHRMPIKEIVFSIPSFACFLPLFVPHCSYTRFSLQKKSIFLLVDPIDPLCKFTMMQNPLRITNAFPLNAIPLPYFRRHPRSSRRPLLSHAQGPSSGGLFIAAPIIRLSVLGRIFFVMCMTALQRVSRDPAACFHAYLSSLLMAPACCREVSLTRGNVSLSKFTFSSISSNFFFTSLRCFPSRSSRVKYPAREKQGSQAMHLHLFPLF